MVLRRTLTSVHARQDLQTAPVSMLSSHSIKLSALSPRAHPAILLCALLHTSLLAEQLVAPGRLSVRTVPLTGDVLLTTEAIKMLPTTFVKQLMSQRV
jgi:hypothetical protein